MIATYLNQAMTTVEELVDNSIDHLENWQSACLKLSGILQGMGLFEASQWWCCAALEQPHKSEVYRNIGEIYDFLSASALAIDAYEKSLKITNNALSYHNLAAIYNKLGQADKATAYWYQAFILNPEQITARNCYKLAKALLKQNKIAQAIECYQQAIKSEPHFWASYYDLAEIFTAQKDWDKAQICYEQLIEQDSSQVKAYYTLGMLYIKQNQPDQAIVQFRRSTQLKPNFALAYRETIKLQMRFQQWDQAIATCQQMLASTKSHPWLYVYLGNCHAKLGHIDEAKTCYQKVCELRGWLDCSAKDYCFTQDNFTFKISIWTQYLQPFVEQPEIQVLEIGSSQGMTTCWLLDHILTHPSARLTCIDKVFTEMLMGNIAKTTGQEKVKLLKGKPSKLLATHPTNFYDLINVDERQKQMSLTEQELTLYWQLLKEKGLIFLSKSPNREIALSSFLKTVDHQAKIFHYSHQIVMQKLR